MGPESDDDTPCDSQDEYPSRLISALAGTLFGLIAGLALGLATGGQMLQAPSPRPLLDRPPASQPAPHIEPPDDRPKTPWTWIAITG